MAAASEPLLDTVGCGMDLEGFRMFVIVYNERPVTYSMLAYVYTYTVHAAVARPHTRASWVAASPVLKTNLVLLYIPCRV